MISRSKCFPPHVLLFANCYFCAEEMRSQFAAEGNSGLLIAILGLIHQNRHSRYLYHAVVGADIEKGNRASPA
jgi:hypothetical protein